MNLITITRRVSPFRLIERVEEGDVSPSTVSQNVQPFEEREYRSKRGERERRGARAWMQTSGFRDRRAVLYDLVRCQRNLHDLQPNRRCVNHVDQPVFFHLLYKYRLATRGGEISPPPRIPDVDVEHGQRWWRWWWWSKEGRGMKNRAKNNGNVVSPRSTLSDAKKEKSGCRRGWGK